MLRIPVIEATQAIQFCMSALPLCSGLTGSRVPCNDNTVPLVAEKPTVLRLYVTGATPGALVGGLVTEPVQSGIYGSTFTIAGVGGMTATPLPPTRTDPSTTLQVSIKPHAAGTYRFDVIVTEDDASGTVVATASSSITLQFVERRRQRIRLVRIHYTGTQNGVKKDVAPRTVRDFWDATDYAQRVLPIPSPGFEIVKESVEDYDGNFTRIDPSAHDTTWPGYAANRGSTGNLLNILDRLVGAESLPADVVYVAIYPPGVRMSAFAGWAVGRWIISDLDGTTLAHELAHKNGVPQHAPCGNPDNVDPNFPDFPSFSVLPAASIGEVGFDSSTLKAYNPQSTFDLMSYCSPKWISPYNYRKVFDQLPPLPPTPPTGHIDRPDRSIFLSFVRFPDRWVVVDIPGFARPIPPRPPSGRSPYEVIGRDDTGTILTRSPAFAAPHEVTIDGLGELVEAEVPWQESIAAFELVHRNRVLARRDVGPAPALDAAFPPVSELEARRGRVSYRVEDGPDVLVAVRFTRDSGETWTASVARGTTGTVDVDALIDGPGLGCRLEVLATGGGHTAVVRSKPFRIAPRESPIMAWARQAGPAAAGRLELFAIANGGAARSSGLSWTSDLNGDLGRGARLSAVLKPGRHRIEVRSDEAFIQPASVDLEVRQTAPASAGDTEPSVIAVSHSQDEDQRP
jgi:hypothetical protein